MFQRQNTIIKQASTHTHFTPERKRETTYWQTSNNISKERLTKKEMGKEGEEMNRIKGDGNE